MIVLRRLYFYGIAFVSLLMVAIGLSGLGDVLVDNLGGTTEARVDAVRSQVTQNAALVLVGLPVWALHWRFAERAARGEPDERQATLRHLYLYAVLLVTVIRWGLSGHDLLVAVGRRLGGDALTSASAILNPLPWLAVTGIIWGYHRYVVIGDRAAVGERGG